MTGATGATGAFGEGLGAYGHAVGTNDDAFDVNEAVRFNLGGLVFPNVGITPPAPGGISFIILSSGDYEYNFFVAGQHSTGGTTSMVFGLFLNGVSAGVPHTFRSNQGSNNNDVQVVRGQGLISIAAGVAVSIENLSGEKVNVTALAPGGVASANRTLTLKKLSF